MLGIPSYDIDGRIACRRRNLAMMVAVLISAMVRVAVEQWMFVQSQI